VEDAVERKWRKWMKEEEEEELAAGKVGRVYE
jgi:hypothetical protein